MSSFRRYLSSRANAQRSTGPRTEAGKRRSSQNARVHGCRSQTFLIPDGDDRPAYDLLASTLNHQFQPATPAERDAIDELIQAEWRSRCVQQCIEAKEQHSDSILEILQLPGYLTLTEHASAQGRKTFRAFEKLVAERKSTNEATLQNP